MEKYLKEKIRPFNPASITTVEDALVALQGCSFQGRRLGNALETMTRMAQDKDCLRVLTLAGAMIPAGMEEIICQLIERKIIGAIVSTGANIIHSLINVIDPRDQSQVHYIGSTRVDDHDLYKHSIDRVYDTFLTEPSYWKVEDYILAKLLADHGKNVQIIMTPSQFIKYIADSLPPNTRSFLKIASDHGVPVFCGAFSDSELGLNIMRYRKLEEIKLIIDDISDIDIFGQLILDHTRFGTIILGGGVPRNWAQQIFPYIENMVSRGKAGKASIQNGDLYQGYHYSVRFHTALEYDGGLSGCTISESISWGKYQQDAEYASVWGDSTVYFPLLMTALFQRIDRLRIDG